MSAQAPVVGQASTAAKKTRKRILTGDRPTGKLHVGNYVGTLANRVRLQDEYETYLLVADHHMLTTRLDRLSEIEQNIRDDLMTTDEMHGLADDRESGDHDSPRR